MGFHRLLDGSTRIYGRIAVFFTRTVPLRKLNLSYTVWATADFTRIVTVFFTAIPVIRYGTQPYGPDLASGHS